MTETLEALERRLENLRAEVRRAVAAGDRDRAMGLRAELRDAERQWDHLLVRLETESDTMAVQSSVQAAATAPTARRAAPARTGALLPAREQVHQALTLLGASAAPRLIVAVHDAFYSGRLAGARLTSLRRDEERSFRSAPYARPYYLCAALTADLLAPARGLLAISTWPMDRRVIGPLSPRVDYLTAAIRVAERFRELRDDLSDVTSDARRLLSQFAANIPHTAANFTTMSPDEVAAAARVELAVHQQADSDLRAAAALRARAQLDDTEQLFGAGLRISRRASSDA